MAGPHLDLGMDNDTVWASVLLSSMPDHLHSPLSDSLQPAL